jgi:hypothetical protein
VDTTPEKVPIVTPSRGYEKFLAYRGSERIAQKNPSAHLPAANHAPAGFPVAGRKSNSN